MIKESNIGLLSLIKRSDWKQIKQEFDLISPTALKLGEVQNDIPSNKRLLLQFCSALLPFCLHNPAHKKDLQLLTIFIYRQENFCRKSSIRHHLVTTFFHFIWFLYEKKRMAKKKSERRSPWSCSHSSSSRMNSTYLFVLIFTIVIHIAQTFSPVFTNIWSRQREGMVLKRFLVIPRTPHLFLEDDSKSLPFFISDSAILLVKQNGQEGNITHHVVHQSF